MLNKKKMGLMAVVLVLAVIVMEALALRLGSLELNLPDDPPIAENPGS